jgi:hypothetical protein
MDHDDERNLTVTDQTTVRCTACNEPLVISGTFLVTCFDSMLAYGRGPHAHETLPLDIWEVPDVCSHECMVMVMGGWPRREAPDGLDPHYVERHFLKDGAVRSVRFGKLAPAEPVPRLPRTRSERALHAVILTYAWRLEQSANDVGALRGGAEASALRAVCEDLRSILRTGQLPTEDEASDGT